jgi:nucleotide-binding universal stress UspA family protein
MGLRVKTVVLPVEEGEEYRVIERVAENEGVSLIVMGARGRSIITGLLLGSVSTNVLRYGSHDVLIMRYKTMDDGSLEKFCALLFSKILLPTDFSKPGMAAIDLVKKHKLTNNAHLINIVARGESPKQVEARVSDAKNKLQVISDDLAKAGVKSTIEVVSASAGEPRTYGTGGMAAVKTPFVDVGGAAEKILSKAEEMDVSLIALSSAGKGYLDALTIGSVVFDTARMGKRPILVVRSGR